MTFDGSKSTLVCRVWKLIDSGNLYTKHEIAEKCFTTGRTLDAITRLLKSCGLMRIHEWRQSESALVAYWGFGPGEHAPKKAKLTEGFSTTASGAARAALNVMTRDMVSSEVASFTDYHPVYIEKILRHLAYKTNEIHVVKWLRNQHKGGAFTPIYRKGKGINKPKPKAISRAESNRARRARIRKEFGEENAKKILSSRRDGGAEKLFLGGEVVYERQIRNLDKRKAA